MKRKQLEDSEQFRLYDKMQKGKATAQELVHLSLLRGMITQAQYDDYLQIEKDCMENNDE